MIGQTISHYQLQEKLGEGGMGVVYLACDIRFPARQLAVKMLRPHLAADAALRRRLITEARATARLNHPGVETFHDLVETEDGGIFIVYEYIKGSTLRKVQAERPLSLQNLLKVFIEIGEALAAAHDSGITHRDLKPENVMLRDEGGVKVLDFGLAKVSVFTANGTIDTRQSASGLLVGTIPYMSPEQLAGEDVDHRSDIFSFGTMLYEAATGQHPFEGKSPGSTIGNIQKEEPRATARWIEGAIPEVERIARKCLRKDRAERYQSFRDLLVDLNAIRRGLDSGETQRTTEEFDFRLPIGPAITRGVFLFIQGGYLALYGAVFYWGLNNDGASIAQIIVEDFNIWDERVLEAILVLAMVGIAIRLYLISAVGWNHPEAGKNFVRLFPGLVVFDGVWAAAPLLMIKKWQLLTLGFVACMAYVAFAQRTLILSAYPGARYRTTTLARPSSRHD